MKQLRVAPAHEVPRIAHSDLPSTVGRLRSWLLRGASSRSYAPSRALARPAIEHTQPRTWLLRQCDLLRLESNRAPNKQVINTLWDLGDEKTWRCYPPLHLTWTYRSDLGLLIPDDLQIVEGGRPYLFWIQARTGPTVPSPRQLGLLARIFLMAADEAGYEDLGIYIADLRTIEGEKRGLALWTLDDLPVATEAEVSATLQLFADAYDVLRREGFDPAVEKRRRAEARAAAARAAGIAPSDDLFP